MPGYKFSGEIIGTKELVDNLNGSEALVNSVENQLLREIGRIYVPVLKSRTPQGKTGRLRNVSTFTVGSPQDQRLEVRQSARTRDGVFYGPFVRGGTRPHVIRPRRASVLAFMIGDQLIFAKQVNHPGNAPNPYHQEALQQVQSQIDNAMEQAGFKVVSELAQTGFKGTFTGTKT